MGVDIETEGLSEFSQELLDLATKDFPKDTKNFSGSNRCILRKRND